MRKILGMFILIAGILIAVTASSAHFAYFEASRDVHVAVVPDDAEFIDLVPLQQYAFIDDDGTLVIDLSTGNENWEPGLGMGVSPNSTYVFKEVFGVSNHLWEGTPICVHIQYSASDQEGAGGTILFFTGDYTGQAGATELTFTVMPGETVKIGMILDSTDMVDGEMFDGKLSITAYAGACAVPVK